MPLIEWLSDTCLSTAPTRPRVGVFDSGMGGLSVLKHLVTQMPHHQFIYVADNAHTPYGDLCETFIQSRAEAIVAQCVQWQCEAVVVACNTATTWAIKQLRDEFSLPIFGVEPAVKPALTHPDSRHVAVVATTRTLESESFRHLCSRFSEEGRIDLVPCPGWVDLVESLQMDSCSSRKAVRSVLSPLMDQGVDTVVLGCTHFPFLWSDIQSVVGPSVRVIEPGAAVARHVRRQLLGSAQIDDSSMAESVIFALTSRNEQYWARLRQLWQRCCGLKDDVTD